MDRRVFLRETVMGIGVVACGVGGLWARRSHARGQIVQQLVDSARPVLDKHALQEQEQYPVEAGEKIRRYFDGISLNVEGFLGEISAPAFRKKLSKVRTAERRHHELLAVFYRRVEGAASVGERIQAITEQIGPKLDQNWSACCTEIAARWELRLHQENGPRFDTEEFSRRVTPLVRIQVDQAVRQARRVTQEPGWREAVRSLGAEALQAGQNISFDVGGRTVEMPDFVVTASHHAFGKVLDYLSDPQWDCQKAITERLKYLGNGTAASFEKELRRRLNGLHLWREQAVRLVAEQHAAERVGFFGEHG